MPTGLPAPTAAWLPADPGEAWLPAALNHGHAYSDRVGREAAGRGVCAFYAARYRHSSPALWAERLAAGQIRRNGRRLQADTALEAGDRLIWQRPPWPEGAVPALPAPLVDDGDLVVFNKPSGLPVLPAGGWLEHTVLGQIEHQLASAALASGEPAAPGGSPRPVHRLGRFTSGLLLCARRAETRAWLSALLRDSTALADDATKVALSASPSPHASPWASSNPFPSVSPNPGSSASSSPSSSASPNPGSSVSVSASACPCRKTYRALLQSPLPGSPLVALQPGDSLVLRTPIGRRPHARLGTVWAAAPGMAACSTLTLLQRAEAHWLVELTIASGRPHQIRIHAAAAGAPLLGDPLYGPGGVPSHEACPGDGGYHLHAHRLRLPLPDGRILELEAPLPQRLQLVGAPC